MNVDKGVAGKTVRPLYFSFIFSNKNIVKKISMWYDDTVLYLV